LERSHAGIPLSVRRRFVSMKKSQDSSPSLPGGETGNPEK
jgi:hypothetical protein